MQNTNIVKIIIIITLLVLCIGVWFAMKIKKDSTVNPEVLENTQTSTIDTRRVNFNTQNPSSSILDSATSSPESSNISSTTPEINPLDYIETAEAKISQKIKKLLSDWSIIKDKNLLIEGLKLSEGADNESILEAWTDFMKKDSIELLKLTNTSSNIKKTKNDVRLIFEWFINLSGEYEKLSSGKRIEIKNQYNQLK